MRKADYSRLGVVSAFGCRFSVQQDFGLGSRTVELKHSPVQLHVYRIQHRLHCRCEKSRVNRASRRSPAASFCHSICGPSIAPGHPPDRADMLERSVRKHRRSCSDSLLAQRGHPRVRCLQNRIALRGFWRLLFSLPICRIQQREVELSSPPLYWPESIPRRTHAWLRCTRSTTRSSATTCNSSKWNSIPTKRQSRRPAA